MLTLLLDGLHILQSLHICIADNKIKLCIDSHVIWIGRLRNEYKTRLDILPQAELSNGYSILISCCLYLCIIKNGTVCNG